MSTASESTLQEQSTGFAQFCLSSQKDALRRSCRKFSVEFYLELNGFWT